MVPKSFTKRARLVLPLLLLIFTACGIFRAKAPRWTKLPEVDYAIPPYARYLKGVKICLDPGHGGDAHIPGYKRGPTGVREAEMNLRVAAYLRDFLAAQGAEVIMTREDDSHVSLADRSEIANQNEVDFFLSLHHNASSRETANYASTWYHIHPDLSPQSMDLARNVHWGVYEALRLPGHSDDGLLSDQLMYPSGFGVLRRLEVPGVLLESSFYSNYKEEKRLTDPEYNRREAYGIFLGIARYAAGGFPSSQLLSPAEVTQDKRPPIRLRVNDGVGPRGGWDRNRLRVFTSSIRMLLDGDPVPHQFDAHDREVAFQPDHDLTNDVHVVEVELENMFKNHNLPQPHRFSVASPARFITISTPIDTLPPDGIAYVPIDFQVLDADSTPVIDGTPLRVSSPRGTWESQEVEVTGGRAVAYFHADTEPGLVPLYATVDEKTDSALITLAPVSDTIFEGILMDNRNDSALAGARMTLLDTIQIMANEDGRYFHRLARPGTFAARYGARGYFDEVAERRAIPGRTIIADARLRPVAKGLLHDWHLTIDPQFGGSQFGDALAADVQASDVNLQVAQRLGDFLDAAGGQAHLVRDRNIYLSVNERIAIANAQPEGWYIRLAHHALDEGQQGRVEAIIYPGNRVAKAVGEAVIRRVSAVAGLQPGEVRSTLDVQEVRNTNKTALSIEVHTPSSPDIEAEAYAIFSGILEQLAGADTAWADLQLRVTGAPGDTTVSGAEVRLGNALSLHTDSEGRARFQHLEEGMYEVAIQADGYEARTMMLDVPADTVVSISKN